MRTTLSLVISLVLIALPVIGSAGPYQSEKSCYWSTVVHEENSLTASLLYLPYIILMGPVRFIDAVVYPKPTTQATMPPAAHRVSH